MVINQGDILWADFGRPRGSGPGGRRPALVVQSDSLNHSSLSTVVVAALTTSSWAHAFTANVRFRKGEANLPRSCVASVARIMSLDKRLLREKIGTVSREKLEAVLHGIDFVLGRA